MANDNIPNLFELLLASLLMKEKEMSWVGQLVRCHCLRNYYCLKIRQMAIVNLNCIMDYQRLYEELPKHPVKWTVNDIETWLKFVGLSNLYPKFSTHSTTQNSCRSMAVASTPSPKRTLRTSSTSSPASSSRRSCLVPLLSPRGQQRIEGVQYLH